MRVDVADYRQCDEELRGYRPHLDGLRAVAVYLVVIFHAGSQRFEGGFIGVDVFFVLSGFLVTRVILTSRASGSFTLRTFYARRVRRLLPAAVAAILGIAWLWSVIVSPAELLSIKDGFVAALLYVANWFFISESTDYFASDLEASPVLHFWSLAIEEQFYILWPLILLCLLRLESKVRAGDIVSRAVVAIAALSSLGWAVHLAGDDLNRAYYGTDARAYQLLAGALLALSPRFFHRFRRYERFSSAASVLLLGALLLVATSILVLDPIWRGALTTVLVVGLLVALETGAGPVKAALSLKPVTYLGQISYGTYLWHWPIVLIAQQELDLSAGNTFIVATIAATGVAALSSRMLELPIRESVSLGRFPRQVMAGGLAISLVGALVAVPFLTDPDRAAGRNRITETAQPVDTISNGSDELTQPTQPTERIAASSVDWQAAADDKTSRVHCRDKPASACTIVEGTGAHVLLVGDSHAVMLVDTFRRIAESQDLTLSTAVDFGCSWIQDLNYPNFSQEKIDECNTNREDWYGRLLPELDPDVIVTSLRSVDDVNRPVPVVGVEGNDPVRIGEFASVLASSTLDRLSDSGRRVVLLEPIPLTRQVNDPISCLSEASFVDECVFEASPLTVLEQHYRDEAAARDNVWSVDYDRLVCPNYPRCEAVVDGVVSRWDSTHLTRTFALAIADDLGELLAEPFTL